MINTTIQPRVDVGTKRYFEGTVLLHTDAFKQNEKKYLLSTTSVTNDVLPNMDKWCNNSVFNGFTKSDELYPPEGWYYFLAYLP